MGSGYLAAIGEDRQAGDPKRELFPDEEASNGGIGDDFLSVEGDDEGDDEAEDEDPKGVVVVGGGDGLFDEYEMGFEFEEEGECGGEFMVVFVLKSGGYSSRVSFVRVSFWVAVRYRRGRGSGVFSVPVFRGFKRVVIEHSDQ